MVEFAYNNIKNASIGDIAFELNCGFYLRTSKKEDVDPCCQSKLVDELANKFRELMAVCIKNLQHAQKLQKRYYNKHMKPRTYASGKKVWVNNKYIKNKQNCKLEAKFFGHFRVLYSVGKQAYKLELSKKWKIYNVLHVLLLEQDTIKKGQVETAIELDKGNSKKYEVEIICNSAVYARKLEGHLPGLYYLIS